MVTPKKKSKEKDKKLSKKQRKRWFEIRNRAKKKRRGWI